MKSILGLILLTGVAFGQTNTPPMPLPGVRSITIPVPNGYTPTVFVTNGWATIDFVPILVPPKLLRTEPSGTNLVVHWSVVPSGATAFQLQHRIKAADGWEDVASSISTNAVSWTDTDVPKQGNVSYRIRALGQNSKGAWSETLDRIRP